jgi:phage terminase large subunit GpA-like protein
MSTDAVISDSATSYKIVLAPFFRGLKPTRRVTVSGWADAYRVLDLSVSNKPGQWKNSTVPYLVPIMNALSVFASYKFVACMKATQVALSSASENFMGYGMHIDPSPMLLMLPTVELAKKVSKTRIKPLIRDSPVLNKLVAAERSRDSSNTLLQKDFPGGSLFIVGANSPSGASSVNVKRIVFDEIDRYPPELDDEGDVIATTIKRTDTYDDDKKISLWSTPTVKGNSHIEKWYISMDQNRLYVPCPHCKPDAPITPEDDETMQFAMSPPDGYLRLELSGFKFTIGNPAAVYYPCPHCGKEIHNHHKRFMLPRYKYVPDAPEKISQDKISFHVPAFYSPFKSWATIADEYEQALTDTMKMKTFVQTTEGFPYEEEGDQPPYKHLYLRGHASNYRTTDPLPEGVGVITCGIDVQANRIEMEVLGHGRDGKTWSLNYFVLHGDPMNDVRLWNELTRAINTNYYRADTEETGEVMPISMTFIDSAYATNKVYEWALKMGARRVMPIAGGPETMKVPISTPGTVYIKIDGKKGPMLHKIEVNGAYYKERLYGQLRGEIQDHEGQPVVPPGYCYFPADYSETHYRNLVNEKRVMETNAKGFTLYTWKKTGRNEQLDCRVYAMGAAELLQVYRYSDEKWNQLTAKKPPKPDVTRPVKSDEPVEGAKKPAQRKGPGNVNLPPMPKWD